MPVFHDWRLRECDYGTLSGAPAEELEATKHIDVPFPRGESYRDVVERVASFLDDLCRGWDGWQPGWELRVEGPRKDAAQA